MFRPILGRALVLGALAIAAGPALAEGNLGAEIAPLLAHARSHPHLAAAALRADMAAARIKQASSLEDPKFSVELEDNERRSGVFPDRLGERTYMVEQSFPLGPKLSLRKAIAKGEFRAAEAERDREINELVARIKIAQADRFLSRERIRLLGEFANLTRRAAETAETAYGQGRGEQTAPLAAQLRIGRNDADLARAEALRRRHDARLNGLLGRAPDSALVPPAGLAPLPAREALEQVRLASIALSRNPGTGKLRAHSRSADARRRLADAEWYPDVSVGLGAVERGGGISGYEATISVNIPLRWGLREAKRREAVAEVASRQAETHALELELAAGIAEALASLDGERRVETVLVTGTLPRARAAAEAELAAFEQGRGGLDRLLDARMRLIEAELELLDARVAQRRFLAEIERLIGEDL